MRCGLDVVGGVGQLVVVGIRPYYQGLWVGSHYFERLVQTYLWGCRIG